MFEERVDRHYSVVQYSALPLHMYSASTVQYVIAERLCGKLSSEPLTTSPPEYLLCTY